jgi:hypothetical protein
MQRDLRLFVSIIGCLFPILSIGCTASVWQRASEEPHDVLLWSCGGTWVASYHSVSASPNCVVGQNGYANLPVELRYTGRGRSASEVLADLGKEGVERVSQRKLAPASTAQLVRVVETHKHVVKEEEEFYRMYVSDGAKSDGIAIFVHDPGNQWRPPKESPLVSWPDGCEVILLPSRQVRAFPDRVVLTTEAVLWTPFAFTGDLAATAALVVGALTTGEWP